MMRLGFFFFVAPVDNIIIFYHRVERDARRTNRQSRGNGNEAARIHMPRAVTLALVISASAVVLAIGVAIARNQPHFMGNTQQAQSKTTQNPQPMSANMIRVSFGAGCFWGTENYFKKQFGTRISNVLVGYQGGQPANPSYKAVCSGTTGHAEVISFTYNPAQVDFRDLFAFFLRMHNPTTLNRQGNDKGSQYRSAVFVYTPEQKEVAESVIADANTPGSAWNGKMHKAHGAGAVVTTTVEDGNASHFYPAEDYHQAYLEANPGGYCNHRIYIPE